MECKRIQWIDMMKFWGIFSIFIGHFGDKAGRLQPFVFMYHVPLFFFISGCTETLAHDDTIVNHMSKKVKQLLIPFYFFALLSTFIHFLYYNLDMVTILDYMILIVKGCIRNTFIAGSLWFLTCLFSTSILFIFIKKLKYKLVMLGICMIAYWMTENWLPFRPIVSPQWIFNIDSALYYIIYYCLGYIFCNKINAFLTSKDEYLGMRHMIIRMGKFGVGIFVVLYTVLLYFGFDCLSKAYSITILGSFIPVISSLILIAFFVLLSYLFQNCTWCKEVGRNSLFMCGNEYLIQLVVLCAAQIFGINIIILNPLSSIIYTLILFVIIKWVLVPTQKLILSRINFIVDYVFLMRRVYR